MPDWLKMIYDEPVPETEEYGISQFVYRSRLPFHPERLWKWMKKDWPGVIRSKGFFWLATPWPRRTLVSGRRQPDISPPVNGSPQWPANSGHRKRKRSIASSPAGNNPTAIDAKNSCSSVTKTKWTRVPHAMPRLLPFDRRRARCGRSLLEHLQRDPLPRVVPSTTNQRRADRVVLL